MSRIQYKYSELIVGEELVLQPGFTPTWDPEEYWHPNGRHRGPLYFGGMDERSLPRVLGFYGVRESEGWYAFKSYFVPKRILEIENNPQAKVLRKIDKLYGKCRTTSHWAKGNEKNAPQWHPEAPTTNERTPGNGRVATTVGSLIGGSSEMTEESYEYVGRFLRTRGNTSSYFVGIEQLINN